MKIFFLILVGLFIQSNLWKGKIDFDGTFTWQVADAIRTDA